ncbi:hypothetical protein NL676_039806 [Syzygium grande]|nr:hypothetical protein NL676_039806 [Syzygium grande]
MPPARASVSCMTLEFFNPLHRFGNLGILGANQALKHGDEGGHLSYELVLEERHARGGLRQSEGGRRCPAGKVGPGKAAWEIGAELSPTMTYTKANAQKNRNSVPYQRLRMRNNKGQT